MVEIMVRLVKEETGLSLDRDTLVDDLIDVWNEAFDKYCNLSQRKLSPSEYYDWNVAFGKMCGLGKAIVMIQSGDYDLV